MNTLRKFAEVSNEQPYYYDVEPFRDELAQALTKQRLSGKEQVIGKAPVNMIVEDMLNMHIEELALLVEMMLTVKGSEGFNQYRDDLLSHTIDQVNRYNHG